MNLSRQKNNTQCENLNSIIEKFNEDQYYVVNCIMNDVLPGETLDNTYAPVSRPFGQTFDRSRSFFP